MKTYDGNLNEMYSLSEKINELLSVPFYSTLLIFSFHPRHEKYIKKRKDITCLHSIYYSWYKY